MTAVNKVGCKKEIKIDDPIIIEYFQILGFNSIEDIRGATLDREILKERNVIDKYEEQNMKEKLSTIISSSTLRKLAKDYHIKGENDILTITRFILKRLGYDLRNIRNNKSIRNYVITL